MWNGFHVILLHLPKDTNENAYYWMGDPSQQPPTKEIENLNHIAALKTKAKIFKLPSRPNIRYIIVNKGEFVEE
jgi:hypothetical protein